MADHDDHGHDDTDEEERVTAPQQDFGSREVGIGWAVTAVGLLVTFGLAFGLVGF